MSATLEQVLQNLSAYLQYRIDEGNTRIEVTPDVALRLVRRGAPAPSAPVSAPPAPAPAPAPARTPPPFSQPELAGIVQSIAACTRCDLHQTRRQPVPGQGTERPEIMFIGEAPGEDEDRQGLAFVGAAGQLLTRMIQAMGLRREDVFIANILKCRPPGNRKPLPNEIECCLPFLKAQIALLKPKVIVALGGTAVLGLLQIGTGITSLRGRWLRFEGIDVMPTFHPSYLLRVPSAKKEAWEDLKSVLTRLGKPIPENRKVQTDN